MATSETASLPPAPLLSILMPVYNEARTLRTIVARVLASPVQLPMELICVDDGSRDGSPEILDALAAQDSRIRVIHQPRNMGIASLSGKRMEHLVGLEQMIDATTQNGRFDSTRIQ